jgi:hypothetical protein
MFDFSKEKKNLFDVSFALFSLSKQSEEQSTKLTLANTYNNSKAPTF